MQNPESKQNETPVRKFAYFMAWLAFGASCISAVVDTLKDKKPPDRDEYKKN